MAKRTVVDGRQFPTRCRSRRIGKLRCSISYGFPGKNGIAFAFCWDPKPQHDVTASWTSTTGSYTFRWSEVAKVVGDAR